jgi:Aspartyl/Asparaginyl beta-hydroxylase
MDLTQLSLPLSSHWTVPVTATAILLLFVTILVVRSYRNKSLVVTSSSTSCPNPDCIRCRRYRHVQQSAIKRLPWVIRQVHAEFAGSSGQSVESSMDRIIDSIRHPQKFCTTYQAPTVLMVRDLPSKEVVTEFHYPATTMLGQPSVDALLLEEEISRLPSDLWKSNDTPSKSSSSSGAWKVLALLNQGTWDRTVQDHCPLLDRFVRGLPNLLEGCLFGNAMISTIYAGTSIEPHCGPTNVRHRLHYTLTVPPVSRRRGEHGPSLRVGGGGGSRGRGRRGMSLTWRKPGEFFIFDDSMVHSVQYSDHEQDETRLSSERPYRMVLIVDLWHPHLTLQERALLRYMYPPYFKKETKVD